MKNQQYIQLIISDSKEQIEILNDRIKTEKDPDQVQAFQEKVSHHEFMIERLTNRYL